MILQATGGSRFAIHGIPAEMQLDRSPAFSGLKGLIPFSDRTKSSCRSDLHMYMVLVSRPQLLAGRWYIDVIGMDDESPFVADGLWRPAVRIADGVAFTLV